MILAFVLLSLICVALILAFLFKIGPPPYWGWWEKMLFYTCGGYAVVVLLTLSLVAVFTTVN